MESQKMSLLHLRGAAAAAMAVILGSRVFFEVFGSGLIKIHRELKMAMPDRSGKMKTDEERRRDRKKKERDQRELGGISENSHVKMEQKSHNQRVSDTICSEGLDALTLFTHGASRISSNAISLGATSNPVKYIEFEELKKATQNFRSYSDLGEGAFGHFSKGWINENTLTASKPGFGTAVAVKKWKGLEGLNDCLYVEFEELKKKKATKDFPSYSDIGEGQFSHFRRGWIDKHILTASKPGFQSAVAVKMFKRLGGFNGCLKEINYLNRFRHPNIVKLIGYCYEDDMILVYEFIPKGSLDRHLVRGSRDETLPWATRIKVAVGAARALAFLYYNKNPIVHQSFNTADILLDGEFNAKLCNFGLATDVSDSDIECVATGAHLKEQSDVYKFGVFLVDLFSGRSRNRSIYDYNHTSVDWAKPYLGDDRKFVRIMDPKLKGQFPHNAAFTVATIALLCLNEKPNMAEVLVSLEQL